MTLLFHCAFLAFAEAQDPVRVDGGLVSGTVVGVSKDVRVYRGVPYAAPPVGDLRWKPPLAVKPWDGIRKCTEFGPWCPQPKPMLGRELGPQGEDCLTLNIWTAAKDPAERRPVMFWIHGGGFTTGSGASSLYDGQTLAREGAVVVTINYRLGPLGFLGHPMLSRESPRNVSGNYGFLDQIAALEWVRRNIAAFGGDPGCVTIFGESAGAASVCRLMVSPLADGLFHRAIAQSGGAHGRNRRLRERWEDMESLEKLGESIARGLGCAGADDVPAALRAKSAEEVLAASNPSQGLFGKGNKFGPVVDGWAIPEDPAEMWERGRHARVPFLVGTVFLRQLQVRTALGYRLTVRYLFKDEADDLLAVFPAATDGDVPGALNKIVTVGSFVSPARLLARASAGAGSPTWLYHFTRVPDGPLMRRMGAFHGLEIFYVFGNLAAGPMAFSEKDRGLSRAMRAYWLNFARTGNPNGAGLPPWPAYCKERDEHLELGDEVRVGSSLWREACDAVDAARVGRHGGRSEPR